MPTIEELEKYAKEKKMPKRGLDDMIQRLRAEHDEHIDDQLFSLLCAEIDRGAEFWKGVRDFLKNGIAERNKEET